MDEHTVLLCSGNRQRLLLDLNNLGYRVRALPEEAGTFEAWQRSSANADAHDRTSAKAFAPQRYCRTRSLDQALQEALAHRRPVLISGETGAGKEILARALCERSGCSPEFPVVHCQSLHWAASEGRCTQCIEERINTALRSQPGLLLLDEVGDLGRDCQHAVLDILAGIDPTRTRIAVTSNRSIDTLLEHGNLLPEFVEKLDLAHVQLPPLRDQPADIPLLLEWFVAEANTELGTSVDGLAPPAIREAVSHSWPGNAREMRNTVFRAVLRQPNGWIEKLPIDSGLSPSLASLIRRSLPEGTEAQVLMQQFERELLQALHELHGGNKSRIARSLNVSRNTLKSRLRAYNL